MYLVTLAVTECPRAQYLHACISMSLLVIFVSEVHTFLSSLTQAAVQEALIITEKQGTSSLHM